jgi:hypothetical protein
MPATSSSLPVNRDRRPSRDATATMRPAPAATDAAPPVTSAIRMAGTSLPAQRAGLLISVSQSTIAWPMVFRNPPGSETAYWMIWSSVRSASSHLCGCTRMAPMAQTPLTISQTPSTMPIANSTLSSTILSKARATIPKNPGGSA